MATAGSGDLFVFVYFGLVAVTGTYYVQAVTFADAGLFPLRASRRHPATHRRGREPPRSGALDGHPGRE